MKKALIILACILVIAIISKPSDQKCIDAVKDHLNSKIDNSNNGAFAKVIGEIAVDLGTQYGLRVEDKIFFKNIYMKGDDQKLAFAAFGIVIPLVKE